MLSESFCSSPWFHLRLFQNGDFRQCRWGVTDNTPALNIKTTSIMEYFNSPEMCKLRLQLLNGEKPDVCSKCFYQDQTGKLNGRTRQLLKSGINVNDFELSLRSSPHYEYFLHSNEENGHSNYYPVDLQIELGNICNSSCIMCSPRSSSKLQSDYIKLHKVNPTQFAIQSIQSSWTQDPATLDKFINEIISIPNLKYIHFIGGEPFYDFAFYKICEKLIESGVSKNIIVGTTTNGTLYDDRIESLISKFKEFHLGISLETTTALNDYVRHPSNIDVVLSNIKQFLDLRLNSNLYINLRITPNVFTIYHYDQLVDYMMENNVSAESCDILTWPECLKIELLPDDIRHEIIDKLNAVVDKYSLKETNVINSRQNNLNKEVIADTTIQYLRFLEKYIPPTNLEDLRYNLVSYIKSFESIRNNTILDYVPRYTEFLRTYGY